MGGFTGLLWDAVKDVYDEVLRHPFITGLTAGSLDMKIFMEYIIQDALYLGRFAKAVAVVGAKAPDDDSALTLISASRDALAVERKYLHDFLLSEWGIKGRDLSESQMSPVNRAYTDFLVAAAYEKPYIIGLAAILPCFWIYLEVGKELLKRGSPNRTYSRWINTYSSAEYEKAVLSLVGLADSSAEAVGSTAALEEAAQYFRLSTIYEYLFWDAAYHAETWRFGLKP